MVAAVLGLVSTTSIGSARADVTIDGGDVGGQIWTAGQGPYHVTGKGGDVTIPVGKELRIEAGTVVLFSDATPATKLSVAGTLIVEGTAAGPVVLQAAPDATGLWGGIWAGPSTGNTSKIVMTGAVVRKGAFCLWLPRNTQVALTQTTIESCTVGITVEDGTYAFDGITVQRNVTGIDVQGGPFDNPMVTVADSVISGNTSRGVNALSAAVKIVNCTIDGNGTGVNVSNISAPGSNVSVVGSILSNNARAVDIDELGAATVAPITVTASSTTFWANTYNRQVRKQSGYERLGPTEAVPGDGNGVADPKYVSATDLHLTPGSPCVDSAGPPGGTQDRDGRPRPLGAALDRGAYELDPDGVGAGGAGGAAGGAGAGGHGGVGGTSGSGAGGGSMADGGRGGGAPGSGGGAGGGARGGESGGIFGGMSGGRPGGISGGMSGSAGAAAGGGAGPAGGAAGGTIGGPAGGGAGRAPSGSGGRVATGAPADGGCGCTVTDSGSQPLALLSAALLLALRSRRKKDD